MSFDRFFKVALLVVLGALVVVYALQTQHQAYAQKSASGLTGGRTGGKTGGVVTSRAVGSFQVVVKSDRFYVMDTRNGQLYQLSTSGRVGKTSGRWVKLHGTIR